MPAHVAPGSLNVIRTQSLRLCAFAPKAPAFDPKSGRSASDQWLANVELAVLQKGYVILMPLSDGQSSVPPSAENAFLARTSDNGTLVWIEESEIDGAVPTAPDRTLLFGAEAVYSCFWTLSAELVKAVWKDVKAAPDRAMDRHLFDSFSVARDPLKVTLKQLHLEESSRTKLAMLLPSPTEGGGPTCHGTVSGVRLQGLHVKNVETTAYYAIGRSDAVAAMFLAGLLPNGVADARKKTAENWVTIEGIRDLVRSGVQGIRFKDMDAAVGSFTVFGQTYRAGPWNNAYCSYAYDCAKARVPRERFWTAIDVLVTQDDWKEAAVEIWRKYKIAHPAYSSGRPRLDQLPNKMPILRYFDLYEFAFRNVNLPWGGQLELEAKALERRDESARGVAQKILDAHGRYDRFVMELGAHVADEGRRKALHDQYLAVAVQAHHPWWDDLPKEGNDEGWTTFRKYGEWIGTMTSKLGDLMKAHFGDPLQVARYNELLGDSVEQFEKLFRRLADYDRRFDGKTVKRRYGDIKFEADFATSSVVMTAAGEAPQKMGPIHFLVDVEEVQRVETVKLPPRKRSAMKARYKKVVSSTTVAKAIVPNVPFKEIHSWPFWLSAFGNTVALAFMLADVSKQWSEGSKLEVVGKVAMGTFQVIDSVGAAVNTILKRSTKLLEVLEFVGFAGNALEAFFNVRQGYTLCFDGDESEVVRALERGDEVEAVVKAVKGWVLISTAVPGAVAFSSAAIVAAAGETLVGTLGVAVAAASTPLIVGLAVGAIIVVGIDIFLYAHGGPDNALDDTSEKLQKALKREFGSDGQSDGQTVHNVWAVIDELQHLAAASG